MSAPREYGWWRLMALLATWGSAARGAEGPTTGECAPSGVEVTNTTGRIHIGFGNAPSPRPPLCIWNLRPTSGQGLYFTFEYINMGQSADCRLGSITLMDWDHKVARRYCGGRGELTVGQPVYFPTAQVDVVFRSSPENPNMGFILHFQAVACPALAIPHGVGVQLEGNQVTLACGAGRTDIYHCINALWEPPPPEPLCPGLNEDFPLLGVIAIGSCALIIIVVIIVVAACLSRRWQRRLRLSALKAISHGQGQEDRSCSANNENDCNSSHQGNSCRDKEHAGACCECAAALEDREPLLGTEDYITLQLPSRGTARTISNDYSLPPTRDVCRAEGNDYSTVDIRPQPEGRYGSTMGSAERAERRRSRNSEGELRVQFADQQPSGKRGSKYASAALLAEDSFLYDSDDDCSALCPCWNNAYNNTDEPYSPTITHSLTEVATAEEPTVKFTKGRGGLDNPASSGDDSAVEGAVGNDFFKADDIPPMWCEPSHIRGASIDKDVIDLRGGRAVVAPVPIKINNPSPIQRVDPLPVVKKSASGHPDFSSFIPYSNNSPTHRRSKTIHDPSRRAPEIDIDKIKVRKPACHNRHSAERMLEPDVNEEFNDGSHPYVVDTLRGTKRGERKRRKGSIGESLAKEEIYRVGGPHVPIRPPPRDPRMPKSSVPSSDPCQFANTQAIYANLPLNTQVTSSLYSQALRKPDEVPTQPEAEAHNQPTYASPCKPKKNRRPKKVPPPVPPKPGPHRPASFIDMTTDPRKDRGHLKGYALTGQPPAAVVTPLPCSLDQEIEVSPDEPHCPVEDYLIPGEYPSPAMTESDYGPPETHTVRADVHSPDEDSLRDLPPPPPPRMLGEELPEDLLIEPHIARHLGIGSKDPLDIMCRSCPDITRSKIYL